MLWRYAISETSIKSWYTKQNGRQYVWPLWSHDTTHGLRPVSFRSGSLGVLTCGGLVMDFLSCHSLFASDMQADEDLSGNDKQGVPSCLSFFQTLFTAVYWCLVLDLKLMQSCQGDWNISTVVTLVSWCINIDIDSATTFCMQFDLLSDSLISFPRREFHNEASAVPSEV